MNRLKLIALIFAVTIASPILQAAERSVELHWYAIEIFTGKDTETFTGSSLLDTTQLSLRLSGNEIISLENLRYIGITAGEQDAKPKWRQSEKAKAFLLPRTGSVFIRGFR